MLLGSFRDLMFLLNFLTKSKKSKTIPIVIIKKCLLKISLFFLIFKTFKKLKESFPYLDRYQRGLIGHRGEIYRFSLSDYRTSSHKCTIFIQQTSVCPSLNQGLTRYYRRPKMTGN